MHGYASVPVLRNRPTHYDVIASRDCRTAECKHYTTVRRSREKARGTDAVRYRRPWLLYVHPRVSSSPPRRLDAADQPGSCYTRSLVQAYDGGIMGWSPLLMKSTCYLPVSCELCPTLACPLQSANAVSLWVLSRQVWMQLQIEHRFWKNVTGARFWKRVPDNRILLNNLIVDTPLQWINGVIHPYFCRISFMHCKFFLLRLF